MAPNYRRVVIVKILEFRGLRLCFSFKIRSIDSSKNLTERTN